MNNGKQNKKNVSRSEDNNYSILGLNIRVYTIPTDFPESDGTYRWDSTTMVYVEVITASYKGIGYTYANRATAYFIKDHLEKILIDRSALDNTSIWEDMVRNIRNLGRPGVSSMAIAAVDIALWDLKSRILDIPLVTLLGSVKNKILVYGSGGFTSYNNERLKSQFEGWLKQGISMFKMKIGTNKKEDESRIKYAREVIGDSNELFIDANGAYSVREALKYAEIFNHYNISWFEEPVSSDNPDGLRFIRKHTPPGMNIAAGEYGYDTYYFHNMLRNKSVDVLQADATRCAGITGFIKAGILSEAYSIPFSAHTAPSVHLHPCCSLGNTVHIEYFHDHARIENMFFDGAALPQEGFIKPDISRPGLGLELKERDAARFLIQE